MPAPQRVAGRRRGLQYIQIIGKGKPLTHEHDENQSQSRQTQDASNSTQDDQASTVEKTNSQKIASPARVAANRRNAQKSTGPRTSEGKSHSRWNAVQHGLLAKRLFPRDESERATFDHLLVSLRSDWQPEGVLEEILLEKIAVGYHKLSAVYGYEAEFARTPAEFFLSIDRTGRYATSINRQLTQDLHQLERLQRQRKGEFVPAPISFDVNVTGLDERAMDSQFVEAHDVAPIRPSSSNAVAATELSSEVGTTPQLTAAPVQVDSEPSLRTTAAAAEEVSGADVLTSPHMQGE